MIEMPSDLELALAKLDLVDDIGRARGLVFDRLPRCGHGACRDPFRADDKNPSFHVIASGGRRVGYVDYAGRAEPAKGGLWQFAGLCWPELSNRERAERLVELAGTQGLGDGGGAKGGAGAKGRSGASPAAAAARQRRAVEQSVEAQLRMPEPAEAPREAPGCVSARWRDGWAWLGDCADKLDDMAGERGWPTEWAQRLWQWGLISRPVAPWVDDLSGGAHRHWAFAVEAPANPKGGSLWGGLAWMGYHQRHWIDGRKGWVYVPYCPGADRARSGFQGELRAACLAAGVEDGRAAVPPAPFVVGNVEGPRIAVVVEGQWDAASVFGALGGFDGESVAAGGAADVVAFGLRGVKNADWLLRYWGRRLAWWARSGALEVIWLVGDSDTAGRALTHGRRVPGLAPELPFAARLEAAVGCRVVSTWLRGDARLGKDFNDWYKARRPGVGQMWRTLQDLSVIK